MYLILENFITYLKILKKKCYNNKIIKIIILKSTEYCILNIETKIKIGYYNYYRNGSRKYLLYSNYICQKQLIIKKEVYY